MSKIKKSYWMFLFVFSFLMKLFSSSVNCFSNSSLALSKLKFSFYERQPISLNLSSIFSAKHFFWPFNEPLISNGNLILVVLVQACSSSSSSCSFWQRKIRPSLPSSGCAPLWRGSLTCPLWSSKPGSVISFQVNVAFASQKVCHRTML